MKYAIDHERTRMSKGHVYVYYYETETGMQQDELLVEARSIAEKCNRELKLELQLVTQSEREQREKDRLITEYAEIGNQSGHGRLKWHIKHAPAAHKTILREAFDESYFA